MPSETGRFHWHSRQRRSCSHGRSTPESRIPARTHLRPKTTVTQRVWEVRIDSVLKLDRPEKRETFDDDREEVARSGASPFSSPPTDIDRCFPIGMVGQQDSTEVPSPSRTSHADRPNVQLRLRLRWRKLWPDRSACRHVFAEAVVNLIFVIAVSGNIRQRCGSFKGSTRARGPGSRKGNFPRVFPQMPFCHGACTPPVWAPLPPPQRRMRRRHRATLRSEMTTPNFGSLPSIFGAPQPPSVG